MPDRSVASSPFASEPDAGVGLATNDAAAELARLRAALDRHEEREREMMELLGTARADKLVHDLRNLLQERMFLEAACKRHED